MRIIYNNPKDPAVIPTDIIIPNSNNPCKPDGTVINVEDRVIISFYRM